LDHALVVLSFDRSQGHATFTLSCAVFYCYYLLLLSLDSLKQEFAG